MIKVKDRICKNISGEVIEIIESDVIDILPANIVDEDSSILNINSI